MTVTDVYRGKVYTEIRGVLNETPFCYYSTSPYLLLNGKRRLATPEEIQAINAAAIEYEQTTKGQGQEGGTDGRTGVAARVSERTAESNQPRRGRKRR